MILTNRQREVLEWAVAADDEFCGEVICDRGQWWFGDTRTTRAVVWPLVEAALLGRADFDDGGYQIYQARPDAARVLADPNYETMMDEALRTGAAVFR